MALERCRRAVAFARARFGSVRSGAPAETIQPSGQASSTLASATGLDDTLVEMAFLAQCPALIRYPGGSFFPFFAAIMSPVQGADPADVYGLQRPFDPNHAMAILFKGISSEPDAGWGKKIWKKAERLFLFNQSRSLWADFLGKYRISMYSLR